MNLTSSLVEHLRERITSGDIAPGDKLPSEHELIAERGVSRTVVREAISRLQAEGLVHTRRGAGSFALTPPPDAPSAEARVPRTLAERRQLLEFRMGLETEAAARAAGRANATSLGVLDALDAAVARFRAARGHVADAMTCDYEFHLAVARASDNPYFVDAVEQFGPALIAMPRGRFEADAEALAARLERVADEHDAVRDAIAAGDAMGAAAAMRVHLGNSLRRLEAEAGGA